MRYGFYIYNSAAESHLQQHVRLAFCPHELFTTNGKNVFILVSSVVMHIALRLLIVQ